MTCSTPVDFEIRDRDLPYVFTCDLGNPLPKNREVRRGCMSGVASGNRGV